MCVVINASSDIEPTAAAGAAIITAPDDDSMLRKSRSYDDNTYNNRAGPGDQ